MTSATLCVLNMRTRLVGQGLCRSIGGTTYENPLMVPSGNDIGCSGAMMLLQPAAPALSADSMLGCTCRSAAYDTLFPMPREIPVCPLMSESGCRLKSTSWFELSSKMHRDSVPCSQHRPPAHKDPSDGDFQFLMLCLSCKEAAIWVREKEKRCDPERCCWLGVTRSFPVAFDLSLLAQSACGVELRTESQ
eukprot:2568612-Rhodomonas_salina.3